MSQEGSITDFIEDDYNKGVSSHSNFIDLSVSLSAYHLVQIVVVIVTLNQLNIGDQVKWLIKEGYSRRYELKATSSGYK